MLISNLDNLILWFSDTLYLSSQKKKKQNKSTKDIQSSFQSADIFFV